MRYYKPISFALMFLILAVLALCLAPGCALLQIGQPQQTSPEQFQEWEVLKVVPASPFSFWAYYKNPNPDSEIKIVAAELDSQGKLYAYRYFKGINPYEFVLNSETGKYIGGLVTEQTRRMCIECHKNLGEKI